MNKETLFLKIINETLSDNSYLGNDCAYLKELNLLVSQDTLVEDVHFKLDYFTPFELGKKSALVNISDILSGGGEPKYLTISLSGNLDETFIKEFYEGLNCTCNKYKIKVIGGDLTGGDKITVSICIMGYGLKQISSRKTAKEGDYLYLKGITGSSAKGLQLLLSGIKDKNNEFIKAHIEPKLYPNISKEIANNTNYPYSMMDTSDGLYDAIYRISKESNVGFNFEYDKIEKRIDDKELVLFGGEDYGLLICLDPKDKPLADKLGLIQIGHATKENKIIMDGVILDEYKSFDHFRNS